MISAFLWIFNFFLGLGFGISTSEISPLYKAESAYFCATITILLRHPCVSAFSFRANAESRKLDLTEEREKRRNTVIQEAKKEREERKQKTSSDDDIQMLPSPTPIWTQSILIVREVAQSVEFHFAGSEKKPFRTTI